MAENFNPYYKWLGIPSDQLPPSHYRLLGIDAFEDDPDVIEAAADQRMSHLRMYQAGEHGKLSQKLLNEVAAAKVCLLKPDKKGEYDTALKEQLKESQRRPAVKSAARKPSKKNSDAAEEGLPVVTTAVPNRGESRARGRKAAGSPRRKSGMPPWLPWAIGGGVVAVVLLVAVVMAMLDDSPKRRTSAAAPSTPNTRPGQPGDSRTSRKPGSGTSGGNNSGTPGTGAHSSQPGGTKQPNDNGGNNHRPKSRGKGATLAIATECDIGSLQVDERATGFDDSVFVKLDDELQGLEFTRWTGRGLKIVCDVFDKGRFYIIVPQEYTAAAEPSLKALAFKKEPIECELGRPNGLRTHCDVFSGNLPRGKSLTFDLQNSSQWLMLASKKLRLMRRESFNVADTPATPPTTPPGTRPTTPPGTPPSTPPPPKAKLLPIPSLAEQEKILPDLEEVFELSKKDRSLEEWVELAKSLIEQADGTKDDPVAQFVMLRKACEFSAGACDLPTAFAAVDKIGQYFQADTLAMRLKMIEVAAKSRVPLPQKGRMIDQALPVIDEAIAADRFTEAGKLATTLASTAGRVKNRNLVKSLAERRKAITAAAREFKKVETALATLKTNPDDPDANSVVGEYYCQIKGEWDQGLRKLAKGSDETLKHLARQDLGNPNQAGDQLKLGDAWYELSETKRDQVLKVGIQVRAETWYRRGLPSLSGLEKVKVEKRLEKIAEARSAVDAARQPKTIFPCKGEIVAASDYHLDIAVNGTKIVNSSITSGSVQRAGGVFKRGDIIIVRARRGTGRRAFACAIRFEGTKRYLATGDPKSGWMSYRPNSTSNWAQPGQGTVVGPVLPASGGAAQAVLQTSGLRCESIWGGYDQSPSSSYSYTYLILQIK